MTETLPRLLSLQTCERRIREALHTLDRLRASLAALEEPALANGHDIQGCRDKIMEAAQARRVLTARFDQVEAQLRDKKHAARQRRAVHAAEGVQREIVILEARKAAVEEELSAVEARITEDTAALHRSEEAAPTQTEERRCATAALLDQIAATKDALDAAQEERTILTVGIAPFILYEYERIFAHRGGVAVVAIEHETCQGCHLHVPAHLCLELQKTPRLAFCPNCHRIVFVANETPIARSHSHSPAANERPTRRPQRYTQAAARNSKTIPATTSQSAPVQM